MKTRRSSSRQVSGDYLCRTTLTNGHCSCSRISVMTSNGFGHCQMSLERGRYKN